MKQGWHMVGVQRHKPPTVTVCHMPVMSSNASTGWKSFTLIVHMYSTRFILFTVFLLTGFVTLDDVVEQLPRKTKVLLDRVWIQYGSNKSAIHPLIYRHPETDVEVMTSLHANSS